MPNRVDPAPDLAPPDPELQQVAEGFDDGLAWIKVRFRGVTYLMTELEIGEHNKVEKQATSKQANPQGGDDIDMIDPQLQNRLMLDRSMKEPKKDEPGYRPLDRMGTRVYLTLLRVMQGLHYGAEPDELRPPKKDEDDEKGNARGNG